MTTLDRDFVRSQFPAFAEQSLNNTVFFENAGGSHMCAPVMDRLTAFYRQCKIQPYYPNPVSMNAGNMMDESYAALAPWLGVAPDRIYFGPSTSQNTHVLSRAMLGWLRAGDEIIVTNQDHEANIGAWRRLEADGIVVREWRIDPESGSLPISGLEELVTKKTKLLAFTHTSNILGEVNPVARICGLCASHGVRTVVDGVSFAGHGLPDVAALGADIYLLSLYKVYGPHQGVMVIRPDMAELLTTQNHYFLGEVREKRLMPAGPDHAQIAAAKGVGDYFEGLYEHHFDGDSTDAPHKADAVRALLARAESEPLRMLLDYVQSHDTLRLVGPEKDRSSTVSVVPADKKPWDLAQSLGERGVLCGAGHFYSVRLLQALNIDADAGVLRFSLVHYTSSEDVERLIGELDALL